MKLKKYLKNFIRNTYKVFTIKIIYPIQYKRYAKYPIDEKKVIFVEPRFEKTSDSLILLRDNLKERGEFNITEISLGNERVRIRYQFLNTMRYLKEMATAKYVFTTDSNNSIGGFQKREETIVVQAWHACGAFKKFGFSTAELLFGGSRKQQEKFPLHRNYDIVSVSSPEVVWAYEEAMGLEGKGIVKPLGVSRTDVFFDKAYVDNAKKEVCDYIKVQDKKIILYAPTFRGRVREAMGPDKLNFGLLKASIGEEYILIIKHHPFVKNRPKVPEEYFDFVYDVSEDLNIEKLLCAADICISDYSSLVYEYSLLIRPLIFFAYDLEEYFDWRGFYYNYEELTPGPIVKTTEEIVDYIKNIDNRFDKYEIFKFKEKFMSACDGKVTDRILNEVLSK